MRNEIPNCELDLAKKRSLVHRNFQNNSELQLMREQMAERDQCSSVSAKISQAFPKRNTYGALLYFEIVGITCLLDACTRARICETLFSDDEA
jgi:hypothetical protein